MENNDNVINVAFNEKQSRDLEQHNLSVLWSSMDKETLDKNHKVAAGLIETMREQIGTIEYLLIDKKRMPVTYEVLELVEAEFMNLHRFTLNLEKQSGVIYPEQEALLRADSIGEMLAIEEELATVPEMDK